jgi:undecaprenyl-diphosphatase
MEELNFIQSIVLGLVQGFSEFLPISSSGHLILTREILKFPDPGKTYDVIVHIGTLIALLAYFWKDLLEIGKGVFGNFREKKFYGTNDTNIFWFLIISTIPGALFGALFEDKLETINSPYIVSALLITFGLILFFSDRLGRKQLNISHLTWKHAVIVGVAQAIALFPGVSRSGITMTAALMLGFTREASARYAFLISIPITAGVCAYSTVKLLQSGPEIGMLMIYVAGLIASMISGFLCIKYLLEYLRKGTFSVFVVYRIIIGTTLIVLGLRGLL